MTPKINCSFPPIGPTTNCLTAAMGRNWNALARIPLPARKCRHCGRRPCRAEKWQAAHAFFEPSGEESGGHWNFRKPVNEKWEMSYPFSPLRAQGFPRPPSLGGGAGVRELRFTAMTTPGRHLGVFPECAAHWDWMADEFVIGTDRQSKTGRLSMCLICSAIPGWPRWQPRQPEQRSRTWMPPRSLSPGRVRTNCSPGWEKNLSAGSWTMP